MNVNVPTHNGDSKIAKLNKRIRAVQGGTSVSKTISILLLLLIHAAQSDTSSTLTSIVSESFPHLKRGVMRDFIQIMEQHRCFKDERWNKTDFIYTFETGSKIEFFSADQLSKVRGPRRDNLRDLCYRTR
jgi:phage terminase large subunit